MEELGPDPSPPHNRDALLASHALTCELLSHLEPETLLLTLLDRLMTRFEAERGFILLSDYVGEQELTIQSAQAVLRCIQANGARVVQRVVEISQAGRAPKNDPALFALAMCAKLGDETTRAAAYKGLPKAARIGTHLFHFVEYCKAFGGLGGNGFKRALGRWYTEMDAARLALQAIKYQQRDGWSHRDLLRLAHAKAPSAEHQAIFQWIVKGWPKDAEPATDGAEKLRLIHAFELAKRTEKPSEMARLIAEHRLPHEAVPNRFKQHVAVWEALLPSMPPGALLRNLNKLTALGLLTNTSAATAMVPAAPGAISCWRLVFSSGSGSEGYSTRPIAVRNQLDARES